MLPSDCVIGLVERMKETPNQGLVHYVKIPSHFRPQKDVLHVASLNSIVTAKRTMEALKSQPSFISPFLHNPDDDKHSSLGSMGLNQGSEEVASGLAGVVEEEGLIRDAEEWDTAGDTTLLHSGNPTYPNTPKNGDNCNNPT